MNYKQLEQYASKLELVSDELAHNVVTTRKETANLSVLQNYCDFNVFHTVGLMPGLYGRNAIKFVNRNGKQLKRKLTHGEFILFCDRFRIASMRYDIRNFEHFKQIKINRLDRE